MVPAECARSCVFWCVRGCCGWLTGIACELPRLQSARYTLTQRKSEAEAEDVNFRGLVRCRHALAPPPQKKKMAHRHGRGQRWHVSESAALTSQADRWDPVRREARWGGLATRCDAAHSFCSC